MVSGRRTVGQFRRLLVAGLAGAGMLAALTAWNETADTPESADPIIVTLTSPFVEPVTLSIPPTDAGHEILIEPEQRSQ